MSPWNINLDYNSFIKGLHDRIQKNLSKLFYKNVRPKFPKLPNFEVLRWTQIIIHYVYIANEGCEYPLHRMVKSALYTNEVRQDSWIYDIFYSTKISST